MKKYELTNITINCNGIAFYRVRALRDFAGVKAGDLGGFVSGEYNLSQDGNAWVGDNAYICGNACVCDDAIVCDRAQVFGNARIDGDALVCGGAHICGNARVGGNARVDGCANINCNAVVGGNAQVGGNVIIKGDAQVLGDAQVSNIKDYIVFKNWWSSGRYLTWTRSNNKWKVGCFHGTGQELINKAYKDSNESGREYERIVNYVQDIIGEPHLHRT